MMSISHCSQAWKLSVAHLKDFSLLSPDIQGGDVLKAIEMAIPATAIEQAIAQFIDWIMSFPLELERD
ncbi:MAG: hypothetical protein PUP93_28465 [Rhizonema sp. NSF051]|nr:hypothetical protein [Rhizonema sp. NSF051]